MKAKSITSFEDTIGYIFDNKNILKNALTHSSYTNERHMRRESNNERLEFLGDAVLEIITSDYLYHKYPVLPEGELTKKRASIVCEPTLAQCANEIGLGSYLNIGKGEEKSGGRHRDSIISDAMEAVIGALYLDGGFASAKEFITKFILTDIENKQLFYDSKTMLQEIIQGWHVNYPLEYILIHENGPDHDKRFVVEAHIGDKVIGKGVGRTKKAAEQDAAYNGILFLRKTEKT